MGSAYLLISDGVPHVEGVVLDSVLGLYPLLVRLVLALVLLSFLDHALNLILAQPTLVVGDGDLVLGACMEKHTSEPAGSTMIPWHKLSL